MSFKSLFRKKSANVVLKEGGDHEGSGLHKVLNVRDLTFFGIAAIIGGGTFSAIGNACFSGGPAVVILYVICAVACGFTACVMPNLLHAFLFQEVLILMLMFLSENCLHGLLDGHC